MRVIYFAAHLTLGVMLVCSVAHARHMRRATAEMQYSAACATMPPDARQACESLVEAVSQCDLMEVT